jgi:hypothetical protein
MQKGLTGWINLIVCLLHSLCMQACSSLLITSSFASDLGN